MAQRKFLSSPRPSSEVVSVLERALQAARDGQIQAVAIVALTPVHLAEIATGGDLNVLRLNALLGGLVRAKHLILSLLS